MTPSPSGARPAPEVAGDAQVIGRSLRDPERFADIFDRYYAEIHRYAGRRLGADAADDVAAETFCVALRKRDRLTRPPPHR